MSLIILQSADSKQVHIWPPGGKQPISVPRKTKGLEVLRDGTIEMSATAISNAILRDGEERKPAIKDDHPLLSRAPGYVARTQWYQDFQQRLVIIAGVGLFGASTAYGAYWQVLGSDAHARGTTDDLFKSFVLFIYCTMMAFGAQVSPGSMTDVAAFLFALWYAAVMCAGIFYLLRATDLVEVADAAGLVLGGIVTLGIPALVLVYKKARAKWFAPTQRQETSRAGALLTDPEHGEAAAFIRVFDLYGGVLEYLHARIPDFAALSVAEQAENYVAVIELPLGVFYLISSVPDNEKRSIPYIKPYFRGLRYALQGSYGRNGTLLAVHTDGGFLIIQAFFPPGFMCQPNVDWRTACMHHAQNHLNAARRWYRPAVQLRQQALPAWVENTMADRVSRLLTAEQVVSRYPDGSQTTLADVSKSARAHDAHRLARAETLAGRQPSLDVIEMSAAPAHAHPPAGDLLAHSGTGISGGTQWSTRRESTEHPLSSGLTPSPGPGLG